MYALKIRKRNFLKKGAKEKRTRDQSCSADFKTARNEVSNSINMPNANVLPITSLLAEMISVKLSSELKLVLHLKCRKPLTAISKTLNMSWQKTFLLLILFQKVILSQQTRLFSFLCSKVQKQPSTHIQHPVTFNTSFCRQSSDTASSPEPLHIITAN